MGSTSLSTSTSSTRYVNTPVTQEDVSNPLNLFNSNLTLKTAGDIRAGGNINFNSDAATVQSAFAFGSDLVKIVADVTKQNNAVKNEAAKEEVKEAVTGDKTTTDAASFDWTKYKTELLTAGAVVLFWYFGGFKK